MQQMIALRPSLYKDLKETATKHCVTMTRVIEEGVKVFKEKEAQEVKK